MFGQCCRKFRTVTLKCRIGISKLIISVKNIIWNPTTLSNIICSQLTCFQGYFDNRNLGFAYDQHPDKCRCWTWILCSTRVSTCYTTKVFYALQQTIVYKSCFLMLLEDQTDKSPTEKTRVASNQWRNVYQVRGFASSSAFAPRFIPHELEHGLTESCSTNWISRPHVSWMIFHSSHAADDDEPLLSLDPWTKLPRIWTISPISGRSTSFVIVHIHAVARAL